MLAYGLVKTSLYTLLMLCMATMRINLNVIQCSSVKTLLLVWLHTAFSLLMKVSLITDYSMDDLPFEVYLTKGQSGLGMSLTGGENGGSLSLANCRFGEARWPHG